MPKQTPTKPLIFPAGDSAYVVEFGTSVDPKLNQQVLQLDAQLQALELNGIVDSVPTYRSLLVQFDPLILARHDLLGTIETLLSQPAPASETTTTRQWIVPVCYDSEFALDMENVCSTLKLTPQELIRAHSSANYRVYMIGFTPGYTYLGGLPDGLILPRKDTPRPRVEAGSIAIAGNQACVFSNPAPTGWHVLGRTPLRAFVPTRETPCLFSPGDLIQYKPIDRTTFDRLIAKDQIGQDISTECLSVAGQGL